MAGAGRKVFTREVLGSADVNGYLMDQAVMFFANSAARSAAIPVPAEGMVSTISGSPQLERYRGVAGAGGAWHGVSPGPTVVLTPCGAIGSTLTVGNILGLHNGVTITQPFGPGAAFHGLVIATVYATIQGGSEIALGALGNPETAGMLDARSANSSGTAEARTVRAIGYLDSGSADNVSFQPIIRAQAGTVNPVADSRLSYSLAIVWRK